MLPNVVDVFCVVTGGENCGWLAMLKNSPRRRNDVFSVIRVIFWIDTSKFTWPGPSIIPMPELPNSVEPSVELGATGGAQKAAVLNQPGPPLGPPNRLVVPPGVESEP